MDDAKLDALIATLRRWFDEEEALMRSYQAKSDQRWACYHNGVANGYLVALSNLISIREGKPCPAVPA